MLVMEVDTDRLTAALGRRLAAIVPDGFHVRAEDGMLWYSCDEGRFPGQLSDYRAGVAGTYVRDNLDAHGDVAGVAAQALDELQDFVDEATHDPWPGSGTPPRAHAQVREDTVHLWYGGQNVTSPVILPCEPIPLSEIRQLP